MQRLNAAILSIACAGCAAFAQSDAEPKFLAADVHASAKTANPFFRTSPARAGRYELKTATMVDLIHTAYGFDADKILGGPSWLELDRFDVIAKLPPDATPDSQKAMLQALLKERFQLAVHNETKPMPSFVLTAGKKPLLKEAGASDEAGCKPQAGAAPQPGGEGPIRMMMMSTADGGRPLTFILGPGMTIQYACRKMSMEGFASNLRTMMGTNFAGATITDETGLKGYFNFDLKYSLQGTIMTSDTSERIPLAVAIEKQLGLKLEERPVPTPVIVVDRVERTPKPNPPGTEEVLPPIPAPTEFEVASIKPADPNARMSRIQMQPGGRLIVEAMNLRFIINRAFNTNNNDAIVGLPAFVATDRYDITAKVPGAAATAQMDMDAQAPLLLSLLKDRFKLTYHTEDREVTTYSLVAAKPKMKKADPDSRTWCKNITAPAGTPPGSRAYQCQNATMALLAERLLNLSPDLAWPVTDATGIEGGYDFTLTYAFRPMMIGGMAPMPIRPPDSASGAGAMPNASEPSGGYTIFEALEKQLGLKLEKQKRAMPIIVVDHIEQKPTEN